MIIDTLSIGLTIDFFDLGNFLVVVKIRASSVDDFCLRYCKKITPLTVESFSMLIKSV